MEVNFKTKRVFAISQRTASLSEHHKFALTDHVIQENREIDWMKATVIDREPDCLRGKSKNLFISVREVNKP